MTNTNISKLTHDVTAHGKTLAARLYGVMSMLSVVVLFAFVVVWLLQQPNFSFVRQGVQHWQVSEGQTSKVDPSLILGTDLNKAAYYIWIGDEQGHQVYRYPTVIIEEPRKLEFGNRLVELPDTLKPGQYTMNAQVYYRLNPLKVAEMKLELAKITVQPRTR
ncbi:hypothetical protein [Burkholderia phage BCSR5]|nr:hypothetical protein [Burkholderia phage BCSR5]